MERWTAEHGRVPKLSLTHDGSIGWADKAELLGNEVFGAPLIGREFIGNGKAEETRLIRILRGNIGGFRRMPSRGPYATDAEIAEIAAWIDAGTPD
jgi:mono/diheme cytochrome c family protein